MAVVDFAEDLPQLDDVNDGGSLSSSRQLSAWLRRTRQNKIRKIVREVYLRDDIHREIFDGADQVLVLDTAMVIKSWDQAAYQPDEMKQLDSISAAHKAQGDEHVVQGAL
mmetsp:Transcript_67000/g.125174  ORF Transcript_67000/g.125174 Transcript_67000/m.125174 type:complete len:110 (+) Transcript_67000:45-374(+)